MNCMVKVLLVDDELLARNHIKTLIDWEKQGYTICGEAGNGVVAVEMIKAFTPDIAIVDISMPAMDGITLTQYINQNGLNIKIIIISSYQDYDYVRETMKNGAIDYLLKHRITKDELLRVLDQAKLNIETERKKQSPKIIEDNSSEQHIIMQDNIRKLLLGIDNKINILLNEKDKQLRNIVIVVMQINDYILLYNKYNENERYLLRQAVTNFGYQIINGLREGGIVYIDKGRFVIIFDTNNYRSEAEINQKIAADMRNLSNTILQYLNIQVLWERSAVCAKESDVAKYYRVACKSIEGSQEKIMEDIEILEKGTKPEISIAQEKKLLSAIDSLDEEELNQVIEDIFTGMRNYKGNDSSLQIIISELITVATKACSKEGIELRKLCNIEELHSEDINNAIVWLRNLYNSLISKLRERRPGESYSLYVSEALKYIQFNYHKNISLTDIAEHIGITSSYLSHLLKKETRKSFIDHLNSIRVHAAIDMISRGKTRINTIYQKVGFNSYNYFFQVFKSIIGVTPANYFKNHKED